VTIWHQRYAVSRSENYIIFYLPLSDGIEVIRVLHGRQDIDSDDLR
jgi:plasmid stabilization system protein ParE